MADARVIAGMGLMLGNRGRVSEISFWKSSRRQGTNKASTSYPAPARPAACGDTRRDVRSRDRRAAWSRLSWSSASCFSGREPIQGLERRQRVPSSRSSSLSSGCGLPDGLNRASWAASGGAGGVCRATW